MREWFMSREPRERFVLGAGAIAASVIVFWSLVWSPLVRGSEQLRDSVEHKSRLLVDLQRAAAVGPSGGSAPAPGASQSMNVLVDSTSKQHGLGGAFTRTRADGTDGVNVTFQDASFDALLGWIVALHASYGVSVESASINDSREPGVVNGQLLLRRN